jgi:hypothetical protein
MKFLLLICNFYLVSSAFAVGYKASNFNPLEHINKCQTGGTIFKSNYYNIAHLYKQFHKENPICSDKVLKARGNVKEQIAKLNQKSTILSQDKNCPELAIISENYLKNYSQNMKNINSDRISLIQSAKDAAKNTNIQIENSHLAWNFLMCASSHTSSDLLTRSEYIKELQKIVYSTPPTPVLKDGQVIEDCHNVTASGNDDLENFYVDMKNATKSNFDISYNTFSVPDHIKVYDSKDKMLMDSGCVGTSTNLDRAISIPTYKNKKIKFEVDGKCSDKNSSTYWQMHISCGSPLFGFTEEEKIRRDKCNEKAITMIDKLKVNVKQMIKVQENEWMHAICQKQHYAKVVPELTTPLSFLMPYTNVNFTSLNWDFEKDFDFNPLSHKVQGYQIESPSGVNKVLSNYKKKNFKNLTLEKLGLIKAKVKKEQLIMRKNRSKKRIYNDDYNRELKDKISMGVYKLLGKPVPEVEDRSLASVAPLTRHQITPFHYGYDDFIKKKEKYCPKLPEKNESIFKTVSYAYCHYGYPKLFDIEDDGY